MTRERGARAGIGRSLVHGLVGWGFLLCVAAVILVTRLHSAEAGRAPLPPVPVTLSSAEHRQWASFPDYHTVVPVLMYHSVGGRASYLTVSRKLFAEQMLALKVAGFHTLTIAQYAHFVRYGPRGLPSRPILLTFDDGRLDAYRAANDILQGYGFRATALVVPAWVTEHPRFSLSWSQLQQMSQGSTWDVQLHFGYGKEEIRYDRAGDTGAAFAFRQYFPAQGGQPGHQETFAQFKKRVQDNMLWGERQLQLKVPGYEPWSMAVPESDYGQAATNGRPTIANFVIGWLNRHFPVVFGGDYLSNTRAYQGEPQGRLHRRAPQYSYRLGMGPRDTLAVLLCRLKDYALGRRWQDEYGCLSLAGPRPVPIAHPLIHPAAAGHAGPPPPPVAHRSAAPPAAAPIDLRAVRGRRVVIGARPGWRIVIRAARGSSSGRSPRRG